MSVHGPVFFSTRPFSSGGTHATGAPPQYAGKKHKTQKDKTPDFLKRTNDNKWLFLEAHHVVPLFFFAWRRPPLPWLCFCGGFLVFPRTFFRGAFWRKSAVGTVGERTRDRRRTGRASRGVRGKKGSIATPLPWTPPPACRRHFEKSLFFLWASLHLGFAQGEPR
ncbi:hypothetical protein TW95_gp1454 [Pandoravirus inopinatum]|uniref:Uncharacterized protein n=1 Tax=Pandoravirus inopinatum TaxID=1605721 RepID=A0A0B5IZ92_9VIRU|nr:hypothetical protein TW95_gp1454 [Pandoravirus inopinatum]AJF98188.1 hypothetical protein [Pandoravirus inopinatum]